MKVYELGARVYGDPGRPWGRMTQLVLEPENHTVSHAVVYSSDDGRARLVPLTMAHPGPDGIHLSCSSAKIEAMTSPVAVRLVEPARRRRGSGRVAWWPLRAARAGSGSGSGADSGSWAETSSAEYPVEAAERLPVGTVAVSQREPVRAVDGDVGRVHGLVLTDDGYRVTHLLLEAKHFPSRKRRAVPADAVAEFRRATVRLRWTRARVRSLPRFEEAGVSDD